MKIHSIWTAWRKKWTSSLISRQFFEKSKNRVLMSCKTDENHHRIILYYFNRLFIYVLIQIDHDFQNRFDDWANVSWISQANNSWELLQIVQDNFWEINSRFSSKGWRSSIKIYNLIMVSNSRTKRDFINYLDFVSKRYHTLNVIEKWPVISDILFTLAASFLSEIFSHACHKWKSKSRTTRKKTSLISHLSFKKNIHQTISSI